MSRRAKLAIGVTACLLAAGVWPGVVGTSRAITPNRSRIFYDSSRTGRYRIYMKTPAGSATLFVHDGPGSDFAPAVSPRGKLLAYTRRAGRFGNYDIYFAPIGLGRIRRVTTNPAIDAFPSWSRTGALAFESNRAGGNYDIYVLSGRGVRRLTTGSAVDGLPAFAPNGKQIAFDSNRSGSYQIMLIPAAGGTARPATNVAGTNNVQPAWSPDGARIAFASNRNGKYQIYIVDVNTHAVTRVTNDSANDFQPDWSRDGTKITFTSDAGGHTHLYMVNPDGSGQQRISVNGGELPAWGLTS